jgi:beta-fructofuranosidase
MFYTGTSRETDGRIQTIGAAVSDDLISWHKVDNNPLVVASEKWYEKLGESDWPDEAWRDPWVYKNEQDNKWHMLVTARSKAGKLEERGVMGHAVSENLTKWEILEPLSVENQGFGHLEVFQFEVVDGVPIVIFCCGWRELSEERFQKFGMRDATYSLACTSDLSDLDFSRARAFEENLVYAGRLVRKPSGEWYLIGFVNEVDGKFVGELSDPIAVTADPVLGLVPRR